MGPITTAFVKGMNAILPQMENSPRKSCFKQATKGGSRKVIASPVPDTELADMEKESLRACSRQATKGSADEAILSSAPEIELGNLNEEPLCACYEHGIECLEIACFDTPSFESLPTKESGLDYIRRSLTLLEQMSTCERCAEEAMLQDFLFLLCRVVLEQCRAFYDLVARTHDVVDQQPLVLRGHMLVTDRESAMVILGIITETQMKRFHTCVGAIVEILRDHSTFDEDAWFLMETQARKLAEDSLML